VVSLVWFTLPAALAAVTLIGAFLHYNSKCSAPREDEQVPTVSFATVDIVAPAPKAIPPADFMGWLVNLSGPLGCSTNFKPLGCSTDAELL